MQLDGSTVAVGHSNPAGHILQADIPSSFAYVPGSQKNWKLSLQLAFIDVTYHTE